MTSARFCNLPVASKMRPDRFISHRILWLFTGLVALTPVHGRAASPEPLDKNLLGAMNPSGDMPVPGAIVSDPEKKSPSAPASPNNLPTPAQIEANPDLAHKTDTLPLPTDNGIVTYPVTERVHSDNVDPGDTATAPAPMPDLAAPLAPAAPVAATKKPAANTSAKKTTSQRASPPQKSVVTKSAVTPPIPKRRPAVARASKAFVDQARSQIAMKQARAIAQPASPLPVSKAAPPVVSVAGMHNPVARNVDAVPLQDMMGQKTSPIGKAQLVETIREISASREPSSTATTPQAPRSPPENVQTPQFLTLSYNSGMLQPNPTNLAVLQGKVLPLLKNNPRWRMQIQAFASPQGKELISARRISLSRALALRSWLLAHGVEPQRLDLRALGLQSDRNPLDRIDLVFFNPDK